jgi:hypothetical protein
MSDAALYEKLRAESAAMLGFDGKDLTAIQGLQADMVSAIRLELDALQAEQFAGRSIDIGRFSDLVKLLRSLLPSAPLSGSAVPDFSGAREALSALLSMRASNIALREAREIAALKQENERLRNLVAARSAALEAKQQRIGG